MSYDTSALVTGFTELLQNVITNNYSVIANSHTLCSSLQHIQSLLSLLYLHQLSPGNSFQCCSFCVHTLTGRRLSHNSLIAPTLLVIISWHGPHRKHSISNSNSIVVCLFIAVETCIPSHCLDMVIVYRAAI
jgi:hypothetical protein